MDQQKCDKCCLPEISYGSPEQEYCCTEKQRNYFSVALLATSSTETVSTTSVVSTKTIVCRLKGLIDLKIEHERELVMAAENEITQNYLSTKREYKTKGEKLSDGWLRKQIVSVCNKRGIPEYVPNISLSTIKSLLCLQMISQLAQRQS